MSPKKRSISFSTRVIIIVSIFLLLMDGLLGGLLMMRSIRKMTSIVRNKVMEIANTAASFLNGDEIGALTIADKENNTDPYRNAYETLSKFKTHNIDNDAGFAYIYCLVKTDDDRIVFSVDPSEDPSEFLIEETIRTDAAVKAFEGIAGFDTQSYVDRWGDLYTAYAPIFGTDNTVKAVVGVDVWASWYKNEIASNAIMIGIVTASTIALGVLTAVFITRKMRKKLDSMSKEMDEIQGDIKSLASEITDPENLPTLDMSAVEEGESKKGLSQLKKQINSTKYVVKSYIEYAQQQAYVDSLSGLGNRNAYFGLVKELNNKINGHVYLNVAVVVFDLNGLKEINDQYGHEVGDDAISIAGKMLRELFTKEVCFRIGGDEFVVVQQNVYEKDLKEKLTHVEEAVDKFAKEKELPFKLTISYGYAFFDETKDVRFKDVFNKADDKMYKQKEAYYQDKNARKYRKGK